MIDTTLKTARLLITEDCHRNCSYCSNKQSGILEQATKLNSLVDLPEYELILLTGGEPLLDPDLAFEIIWELRKLQPKAKIYMYTALLDAFTVQAVRTAPYFNVLSALDGAHFTVHRPLLPHDIDGLENLQPFLAQMPERSWRLSLDPNIVSWVKIRPDVWSEIRIKQWRTGEECIVPVHEDFYRL